jgi:hypothetical protein
LNRKLSGVIPAGVYRGLRLEVSATDLSVDVAEDSVRGDHVGVFDTGDGHSITYRDTTTGRFTLDLSSFLSGETVILAMSSGYSIGVDTTAEFQGYTEVEFDALTAAQRSGLVVLGTVLRPASGVIPLANISHDERDISFLNRASESVPWNPLIRNSGFEISDTSETFAHASPFWETSNTPTSGGAVFLSSATDVESNSGSKSLEVSASVVGGVISTAKQVLYTPVIPGRSLRVSLYKKAIQAATGTNSGVLRLSFEDKDAGADTDVDLSFDVDATDGSFIEMSGVVTVPASMAVLKTVEVIITGTYAGTGACIRIDDVQVWYEVDAEEWLPMNSSLSSEVDTDALIIGNRPLGIDAAKLSFDGTNLVVESRDPSSATTGISADIIRPGGNLLSTVADAEIARVVAPASVFAGVEYTLMWESVPSGEKGYRKYVGPVGTLVETVNASYDNTTGDWAKDVNGQVASRRDQANTGFVDRTQAAGINSWADGAWVLENGRTTDRDGRIRSYWGPEGYRMGPVIEQVFTPHDQENFGTNVSNVLMPSWLHGWSDANVEIRTIDPQSGAGAAPLHRIDVETGAINGQGGIITRNINWRDHDDIVIVMEVRVRIESVGLATRCGHWFGISQSSQRTIPPVASGTLVFKKAAADTNWRALIHDGVATTVDADTTVAPVATVMQTFRIEYHGANTPLGVVNGVAPVAKFYIDGVLVHEESGLSVPTEASAATLQMVLGSECEVTSPPANVYMDFGPPRLAYNEVLDPFVPVF